MALLKGKYIEDSTIKRSKIDIINNPNDTNVLTWSETDGKFKWSMQTSGDTKDLKVSASDTTPGYLNGKLVLEEGKLVKNILNQGGNETLKLDVGEDVFDKTKDTTDGITEGTTNLYLTDGRVDARITAQKGENNGLATLDGVGKIPSSQLPSIAISETHVVADIAARDLLTVETGDIAIVTDASSDADVESGSASYIFDGTIWQKLKSPDKVDDNLFNTASDTTDQILEGSTNLFFTDERARGTLSGGTGINYNSTSGEISLDGELGERKKVEIITLTSGNINNNYIELLQIPATGEAVELTPVGGIQQEYGQDFVVVEGNRVSWGSLGLEGLLEINEKIMVSYTY